MDRLIELPSMEGSPLSAVMEMEDPEAQEAEMARMFSNMFRSFREPAPDNGDGADAVANAMATILGREAAESLTAQITAQIRETEIRQFFVETLREHNMADTTAITKEHFQLANGYSMTIPMTIVFGEAPATKSIEPDID